MRPRQWCSSPSYDGDEHSDIDVLVVSDDAISADDPTWVRSTMDLAEAVQRWSGNGCEVLEYDRAELLALAQRSDPLVASLRADAMPLWADEPHQLLRSVSR